MSDILKITISINHTSLGLGTVHISIMNDENITLLEEHIKKQLVITGDYIDIIHPISRILRKLRDEQGYDFIEHRPEIEFNISLDESNSTIRYIGVDDLSRIQGEFSLENINLKSFSIYNTHYKNLISIDEVHIYGACDSIEIRNLHIKKLISSKANNKFFIGYSVINEWHHSTLTTESEKHGFWSFEKTNFGKVEFISNKPIGDIFAQLDFYQCEFDGKVLFRKVNIETSLKGVANITKGLCFNECVFNEKGFLRILQSNIEQILYIETINKLIELSDSEVEKIFVYQSNFDYLSIIGGKSPGFYNLQTESNYSSGFPSFSELKELYRQLKHSHDSIGNKTEANRFFAKEMEYYMKSLKESGNKKDYWIARLQKEISDFGNDWVRAFGWYIAVCIVGFSISILLSIGFWAFFGFPLDLGDGLERWQRFVAYLNPIPKFEEAKSLWYLIVSLTKGILVYQIIVSLKRISQR